MTTQIIDINEYSKQNVYKLYLCFYHLSHSVGGGDVAAAEPPLNFPKMWRSNTIPIYTSDIIRTVFGWTLIPESPE